MEELLNTLPGGFNAIEDIKERRNVINSLVRMMTAELPPIDNIVKELELYTLSEFQINNLIEELSKIYQSFGYNNIKIEFGEIKVDGEIDLVGYGRLSNVDLTKNTTTNTWGNFRFRITVPGEVEEEEVATEVDNNYNR